MQNKHAITLVALLSTATLSACNGGSNTASSTNTVTSTSPLQAYVDSLAYTPATGKNLTAPPATRQQSFVTPGAVTINSIDIKFYSGESCAGINVFTKTLNGSAENPVIPAAGTYTSTNTSNNALCGSYANGTTTSAGCSGLYADMGSGNMRSMQYSYNVQNSQGINSQIVGACMYNPAVTVGSTTGVEGVANWSAVDIVSVKANQTTALNAACTGETCGFSQTYSVDLTPPTVYLPQSGQTPTLPVNPALVGMDGYTYIGVPWAYVTSGATTPASRFTVGAGIESDCVTDNLTGLMWMESPSSTAYTWRAGTDPSYTYPAQAAVDVYNTNSYCGHSDWYLPTVNDLASLLNNGQARTATWLNAQGFNNVQALNYWSSSTDASNSNNAWVVDFDGGSAYAFSKIGNYYVWPVRHSAGVATAPAKVATTGESGGAVGSNRGVAWPSPRFVAGSGTTNDCITDKLTGLMWPKNGMIGFEATEGGGPIAQPDYANTTTTLNQINWTDALTAVANMNTAPIRLCGYSDWRLPNKVELKSLINYGATNTANWLMYGNGSSGAPACDGTCFANVPVSGSYYWSSSTFASSTDYAWVVNFNYGIVDADDKSLSFFVWPVRGGQ